MLDWIEGGSELNVIKEGDTCRWWLVESTAGSLVTGGVVER